MEEDNDGNGDGHEDDRRGPPPTTRARCQARRSRRRAATCGDRVGKTQTGSLYRREPRVRQKERIKKKRGRARAKGDSVSERDGKGERERERQGHKESLSPSLSFHLRESFLRNLTCPSWLLAIAHLVDGSRAPCPRVHALRHLRRVFVSTCGPAAPSVLLLFYLYFSTIFPYRYCPIISPNNHPYIYFPFTWNVRNYLARYLVKKMTRNSITSGKRERNIDSFYNRLYVYVGNEANYLVYFC